MSPRNDSNGRSLLARKWSNNPEQLDHKFYDTDRLLKKWKSEGHSDDVVKTKLIKYIQEERQKCIDDIVYFAESYGFITGQGDAGIIPFRLEKYQRELLRAYQHDKYIIVNKSRQLGVSTSLVFYALWLSIFSTGKRTLVVAHRRESSEEFITKLKSSYELLPNWLKPSCTLYSKSTVEFDTKSVVKAMTSNPSAARSFSATIFLLDEAAFLKDADEVVKAITPTVAASGGKLIAISTPNGNSEANWFYKTFSAAKMGQNNWRWFEYDWTASSVYARNPNFAQDQIRLDNGNLDKFRQEFCCFPKGTGILTSDTVCNIENIKIGDFVYSHSGRLRKVTDIMNRHYTGKMYKIKTYGSTEDIICTSEHPIRVIDKSSQGYSWVQAQDITKDHLLVFPKTKFSSTKVANENFVKLLAWYITEGSISKTAVTLSLGHKEKEVAHVIELLNSLNLTYTKTHRDTGWQISINNTTFSDIALKSCGSLAENKKIPLDLIAGNEYIFFHELMLGDGCLHITPNKQSSKYAYTTVSRSLAYQIQLLANSLGCGYAAGISKQLAKTSTICGRSCNCLDTYRINISILNKSAKSNKLIRTKYSIAAIIKSIETYDYDDTVYNFSVAYDESYIANGRAVHNCCFDVNLHGLFSKEALLAFKPNTNIINRQFGGITYEDSLHIWEKSDPAEDYIIGVDCAANKQTSKDFTTFEVLKKDSQEQVAEYMGKLPTEVFVDILIKTARHYNNAMLVIESNSYSEMVFYLLEQKGYHNIWYDPVKNTPGFQTNRATRSMLIEKLLLFYNRPSSTKKLKSARLKSQMENFSAGTVYADGSKKFEAKRGNDDLVLALALGVVSLTPKEHVHRPISDYGLAMDTKMMSSSGEYSDEYLDYHSNRMGISSDMLANRLKMYHKIKSGVYDGSGLEDLNLQHPVEEFERKLSESEFMGSMEAMTSDNNYGMIESMSLIPSDRKFSVADIFSPEFQTIADMHRNFLFGRHF